MIPLVRKTKRPFAVTCRDGEPKLELIVGNRASVLGSDGKWRRGFATQSIRLTKKQALHLANSLLTYAARG
jgi:hypothetical protein